MEPTPGQLLAGKLVVIRRLGAGGVGSVWEVEHTLTKHHRALKVLHPRFLDRPEVIERFLREASAAGRIGNPHIVETFDAGKLEGGEPYLLMEMLVGEPFSAQVRHGAMDAATVAWTVRQACLGVAAAHDAGIVHRDLKPDNLFVCAGPDGKPFVKVLDFGVSHFDEPSSPRLTQEGVTLGTPLYMSPEQIAGLSDVDRRTDIYALGVILYEAIAGRAPFDGVSLAALAVQIHRGQPVKLSTLRPDLPPGLEAVVEKAMHVDKLRRYASAAELYDALAPFEIVPGAFEATLVPGQAAPTAPARPFPSPTAPARTASDTALSPPPVAKPPRSNLRLILWTVIALAFAVGAGGFFSRDSDEVRVEVPPQKPDALVIPPHEEPQPPPLVDVVQPPDAGKVVKHVTPSQHPKSELIEELPPELRGKP